ARRGQDRRRHDQAARGDHLVDDQARAAQSQAPERLAPPPHRRGLGHVGPRDQSPAEAIPGYGDNDEKDEQAGTKRDHAPRHLRALAGRRLPRMTRMVDHLSLGVRDLARARAFYDAALAPLGYRRGYDVADASGYGSPEPHPLGEQALQFWIGQEPAGAALNGHICF